MGESQDPGQRRRPLADRTAPSPGKEGKIRQLIVIKPRRLVALAVLACALAAVLAPSAFAHSILIFTSPANDEVVQESPTEVLLRFNEGVDPSLGAIRVLDGQGNQVDSGEILQPKSTEVAVEIPEPLANGTYTVAWRVISADSDPINGAFVFHVGERGAAGAVSIDDLTGVSRTVDVAFMTGRFLDFTLLLLCLGGSAALVLAIPSAEWRVRRRLYGILAGLSLGLALVALLNIVLQGAVAGGLGLTDAFRWSVFDAVIGTRYGEVMLIQAALAGTLALTAMALRHSEGGDRRALAGLTLALGAGLSVTPAASGHASTAGTLAFIADVFHVIAAAVWTGGLGFVVLALLLAGEDRWPLATRAVPRFSNMAVVSVIVLLVAGVIGTYLQVRTWSGLWETEYGLLLLAKIALVLPLLALGAYNNRYSVPRLKAGITSVLEQRRFLQAAGVELAIMVVIVGVTAVLVNAEPARTEAMMAMEEGEHTTMEDTEEHPGGVQEVTLDFGEISAMVVVSPGTPGDNTIEIMFSSNDGGEVPEFQEVSVSASLPAQELGPLEFVAEAGGEHGAYTVPTASLPIAGAWDLRVEALVGEFDLLTETTTINIGEG